MQTLNQKLQSTIKQLSSKNPEFKKYVDTRMSDNMSVVLLSEILVDFRKFFNTNFNFGDYFDRAILVHDTLLRNKRDITVIHAKNFNVNDVFMNDNAFENTFVIFADNQDKDAVVEQL